MYKTLVYDKKEFVLSKQLLKSGTAIGANINEAQAAQSKKDFISKVSIGSKEARDTKYWLELMLKSNFISNDEIKDLIQNIYEIIKILTSIVKTSQEKNEKK